MQIVENSPIVVVDIPRICVPVEDAEVFIQAANRFLAEIKDEFIEKFKSSRLKFDGVYSDGEIIPTVKPVNTYSDILNEYVRVRQIDKYVQLQNNDERFSTEEIYKLFKGEE